MQTKLVNRYYCDYCKKSGCAANHMKRHEERCTLNPHRTCGVCGMLEETQPAMEDLLAMLPKAHKFLVPCKDPADGQEFSPDLQRLANEALPALRRAANNCPACILAAIRQAGIPVPMVEGFDWTKEMKAAWDVFNDATWDGGGLMGTT